LSKNDVYQVGRHTPAQLNEILSVIFACVSRIFAAKIIYFFPAGKKLLAKVQCGGWDGIKLAATPKKKLLNYKNKIVNNFCIIFA
jgi:hypothetical protein